MTASTTYAVALADEIIVRLEATISALAAATITDTPLPTRDCAALVKMLDRSLVLVLGGGER